MLPSSTSISLIRTISSAFIPADSKFDAPAKSLKDKDVCVTGKIQDYHGKPEIIVTGPEQLKEQGKKRRPCYLSLTCPAAGSSSIMRVRVIGFPIRRLTCASPPAAIPD
jgi:hypothetical protein